MANEKRLIPESEREHLIRCLKRIHDADFTPGVYKHSVYGRAAMFLEETADAVEVVHGRWEKRQAIIFDDEMIGYRCSECNTTWDAETNYCPHCGAKMDGDGDV